MYFVIGFASFFVPAVFISALVFVNAAIVQLYHFEAADCMLQVGGCCSQS